MHRTLSLFVFLFCVQFSFAQIGIHAGYRMNDAQDWALDRGLGEPVQLLSDGYSFGIDYWIPLKSYRIDFLPQLNYARYDETGGVASANWASFFLNTNFYFLDFEGDCDCPTFSKSGGAFEKGLFFQLSPGITYRNEEVLQEETVRESDAIAYSIGAGLGLDIGVSDFFTITPMVGFRYFLTEEWEGLSLIQEQNPFDDPLLSRESAVTQWYTGIRLGFRLDQR